MVRDQHASRAPALADLIEEIRPLYSTAQEGVLEGLRRAILEGILAPGARLRQEDLAEQFGTSRIPVREALKALEYEGLVDSEPHRGFTVRALDANEIEEIYELRVVLEGHATRTAIPLLTDIDLTEIDELYRSMIEAHSEDEQLALRERLYLRLFSVTGRPRLVGLIARLRQEVARSLRWQRVQHSPAHHEAFFEAVRHGDAELAVAQLASHYRKVASLLRRYLREGEDGPHRSGGR